MGLGCCRSVRTRLTLRQPGESPRAHLDGGCVARRLRGARSLRARECTNVGPGFRHFFVERRVRDASLMDSAAGVRSSGWMSGRVRPGAVEQYFRQLAKESEHGNEAQEGCEETRQEESQATDEGGQACGETSGTGPGGGSCCTVDGGGPWGKDCPKSRCCLAVSNRVTALGGGRIVCGRALCRQSPIRRHSALEVPVLPAFTMEDPRILSVGRWRSRGALGPKFFYCASQHKRPPKCLIQRRFSVA